MSGVRHLCVPRGAITDPSRVVGTFCISSIIHQDKCQCDIVTDAADAVDMASAFRLHISYVCACVCSSENFLFCEEGACVSVLLFAKHITVTQIKENSN